jgi:AraC-like DNA-binding protein
MFPGWAHRLHMAAFALATACSLARPSPKVTVPQTTQRISINGDLGEWANPAAITFSSNKGRAERDNSTVVNLLWDEQKLYVAFRVKDTHLIATRLRDDSNVYMDDAIEVFIDSKHNAGAVEALDDAEFFARGGTYEYGLRVYLEDDDYQVLVNVLSTVTTVRGVGLEAGNVDWTSDVVYAVRVNGTIGNDGDTDSGYVVELALPWHAMGIEPRPGLTLGADFVVEDTDPDGRFPSDWADLALANQPHLWGDILLAGKGPAAAVEVGPPPYRRRMTAALLVAVAGITAFALLALSRRRPSAAVSVPRLREIAEQAERYIAENYSNEALSTSDAAHALYVSTRYLQTALKEAKKTTFRDMLNDFRLEKAALLLRSSGLNFTHVSLEVGFSRLDSFSRLFRQKYGMSPSEFRKQIPFK